MGKFSSFAMGVALASLGAVAALQAAGPVMAADACAVPDQAGSAALGIPGFGSPAPAATATGTARDKPLAPQAEATIPLDCGPAATPAAVKAPKTRSNIQNNRSSAPAANPAGN